MIAAIKIPSAGESITEVAIGNWLVEDQSLVEKDQEIAEVESDKATLPLLASESGRITILIPAGKKAQVGDIACNIDTSAKPAAGKTARKGKDAKKAPEIAVKSEAAVIKEFTTPAAVPPVETGTAPYSQVKVTPLARTLMEESHLHVDDIIQGLKKLSRHEVEQVIAAGIPGPSDRGTERTPMTPLRRKLSKRLVAVKNETAMLTTFNEVDMSAVLELRKKHQPAFQEKYGLKLGLMSFFIKAASEALRLFPRVNSMIAEEDIVTPHFIDIAVAVQTDKGLMVPVIRDAERLDLPGVELALADLARKARNNKLSVEEMTGGTFTITNGGVFGSMLSTPIINPPQSAILGMHNIVERPVAVRGQVEIRPIMYVALSYDHRLIDGRDSVSFLVKVKELIESPVSLLFQGKDPEKQLLGL
jgi:2-oxoglutarate dehydrogenase E2 component (dihydrolipoamide succinyltransferase)